MHLFDYVFFPWRALPYPFEHAQLGHELAKTGNIKKAQEMAFFQQATLDHYKKPLLSLFRQEKGWSQEQLEKVNRQFFEAAQIQFEKEYHFVDSGIGMVFHRTDEQTVVCVGSGCKSGMGAFLVRESGVLNFGPQLSPLGECGGFGLAGRGEEIEATQTQLNYRCRLGSKHPCNRRVEWLEDSGYCGLWINSCCMLEPNELNISFQFEGRPLFPDLLFTFFAKAKSCVVKGSHKLNPRSLDRYQGPLQPIVLDSVMLNMEGFKKMEVIPLAGDESYWGADFLISFSLEEKLCQKQKFLASLRSV